MKVGVSTASLFMRRENEEVLPLFQRLGVACAEVFLTTFSQYNRGYGEKLLARKGGIEVNSVHDLTSQFEPQLFSRHQAVKKDAYEVLSGVLEVANVLGAPYYTFHGTTRAKIAARNPDNDNFLTMGESFAELSAFCKARGVTLCLENVEWSTYNRPGVFSKVAAAAPDLLGVLDIKQARLSGRPYEEYLEEMGEKIAYVHLSDITPEGKMCLPGKGVFPLKELIKRLQGVGFDGALLIEAYEKDYGKEEELKAACEYVREILYSLGCNFS